MARTLKASCLLAALLLASLAFADPPKDKDTSSGRVLSGKVMDRQDNPLPGAVVYLTNTRTRAVKTYIVGDDGSYRFPALSPNIDYEVFAEYKGHRSDTKTVSQFDSRSQVYINLKIDTK
jgi:Carboxypeptidase regulatory-like domain